MVKLLKKKAKALSPKELADSIHQVDADAEGITLKEYYKRRVIRIAQQSEYKKTHWVSKLTDNQKYLIVTTTPKPHTYMSLPLSKDNQKEIETYKENNEGYARWLLTVDKYNKSQMMSKVIRDGNPRFNDTGLEEVMEEIMWHKIRLNYKELKEQHGQGFEDIYVAYKQTKGKVASDKLAVYLRTQRKENITQRKIRLAMQSLEESFRPLKEASEKVRDVIAKDYLELGRKLKIRPDIEGTNIEIKFDRHHKYGHNIDVQKNRVAVSQGLNTLMSKNKLKKPIDIAEHYINTYNEPAKADYFVDSYDNAVALASATGMLPQRIFKLVCDDLVKRRKHYDQQAFIAEGIQIEEIINLYEGKIKKKSSYSFKMFFRCEERKFWSEKYKYHWKSYQRFMEDFPKWLRIFKANAIKRDESEADVMADFLSRPNK